MEEQGGLAPEHAEMIAGEGIDPAVFAHLREIYTDNPTALKQIRRSELYDEYMAALRSGDTDRQAVLLEEAKEHFRDLYEWMIY